MTRMPSAIPKNSGGSRCLGLVIISRQDAVTGLRKQGGGFFLHLGENGDPILSFLNENRVPMHLRLRLDRGYLTLVGGQTDEMLPPGVSALIGRPMEKSDLLRRLHQALPLPQPRIVPHPMGNDVHAPTAYPARGSSTASRPGPPLPTRGADGAVVTFAPRASVLESLCETAITALFGFFEETTLHCGTTREGLKTWEEAANISFYEREERHIAAKRMRGLRGQDSLELGNLIHLTSLPAGLTVAGTLYLNHCTALTTLPKGLKVGGDLYLTASTALICIPEDVSVGGTLFLNDCTALIALGARLTVGRNLRMHRCLALTELPSDLWVGRDLDLLECTALTALPEQILTWGPCRGGDTRKIYLQHSGLAAAVRARLERDQRLHLEAGTRFYFAEPPERQGPFASFAEEVALWRSVAPDAAGPLWDSTRLLGVTEADPLQRFLERLRQTAHYDNVAIRPILAAQVVALLESMQSELVRNITLECIRRTPFSKSDEEVVVVLTEIELRLFEAEINLDPRHAPIALLALYLGLFKRKFVREHALRAASQLVMVDENEVWLAFDSHLHDRLYPSIPTEHTRYSRCANVTAAMLVAAEQDALAAAKSPSQVRTYLAALGYSEDEVTLRLNYLELTEP